MYSNGVLIMEKCADLLPDYFSFVKGVVDSEDLSLNISRELLQESQSLKLIAKNIEGKIRKELESMLKSDREEYINFFKTFVVQLKYGVYNNFEKYKDKLKDLVMFYSSKHEKLITIDEYVKEMKKEQESIYYASGASISKINSLPQVEQVRDKEYDILYLTDYVDEFCITALQEYNGKKFINNSIAKSSTYDSVFVRSNVTNGVWPNSGHLAEIAFNLFEISGCVDFSSYNFAHIFHVSHFIAFLIFSDDITPLL